MKKVPLLTRFLWVLATLACTTTGYFLVLRPLLPLGGRASLELAAIAVLLLALAGGLLLALMTALAFLLGRNRPKQAQRLRSQGVFILLASFCLAALLGASQWAANTPPILGQDGQALPNSIAVMEKVSLGGADQWLILRGESVDNPVLLFLSGGPGASEAARVLRFNQELEKHFVVAIWEQRGCGKSYPSHYPASDLTIEQYTADIIELSEYLRQRFDEQKIYLVGHSWGTIIGVHAAQARPDLFHAYVGTAQMVDIQETDQIIYDMVLEHSRQSGDTQFVQTLEAQGQPPYLGSSPIQPYSTLFGREYALFEAPNIKNEEYRRDGDILLLMLKQPEYGWLDRVYYLLGLMNTFNVVYPQLQDMDFRLDAARFDLPVYIILGRHDMNNPSQIPVKYFDLLEAPSKQLIFFEDSGHGMIWEEAALFHEIMIDMGTAD